MKLQIFDGSISLEAENEPERLQIEHLKRELELNQTRFGEWQNLNAKGITIKTIKDKEL